MGRAKRSRAPTETVTARLDNGGADGALGEALGNHRRKMLPGERHVNLDVGKEFLRRPTEKRGEISVRFVHLEMRRDEPALNGADMTGGGGGGLDMQSIDPEDP